MQVLTLVQLLLTTVSEEWWWEGKVGVPDTYGTVHLIPSLNHELHEGEDYVLFVLLSPIIRVPGTFN